MSVSFSVPTIALFDNAVPSEYNDPSGRGAVTTSSTTGPCGVYSTWRWYETPGMSNDCVTIFAAPLRTDGDADAGNAVSPARATAMRTLCSTTLGPG